MLYDRSPNVDSVPCKRVCRVYTNLQMSYSLIIQLTGSLHLESEKKFTIQGGGSRKPDTSVSMYQLSHYAMLEGLA